MTPMSSLYGRAGGATPIAWQGDTPMSVTSTTSIETATTFAKPEVDTNMSLSAFQAKYTSEDNESFYKLLDKQNLKKAEKYAWMRAGNNKILAPRQVAHRKRLLAARQASNDNLDNEDKELLCIEPPDNRPAMPDAWPSRPENPLMFDPSSSIEETSTPSVHQHAENTSRAPPKAVVYDNTRLYPPPTSTASISYTSTSPPPSPSLSAVQAALSRRAPPSSMNGPSTPRVAGYSFVDPSPPPTPINPGLDPLPWPSSASLLGSGDATPNPFNIREAGRREALHLRMVDKLARGKRAGGRKDALLGGGCENNSGNSTGVPKFASSPRIVHSGGLTPAGRKLAGRVGVLTPAGGRLGMGMGTGTEKATSGLREGWTVKGS